jgi:hypothetical protein
MNYYIISKQIPISDLQEIKKFLNCQLHEICIMEFVCGNETSLGGNLYQAFCAEI